MQTKTFAIQAAAIAVLAWSNYALAAETAPIQSPTVTINVDGMHCAGCAKKVESKLKAISGVNAVKIDVTTGVVVVSPQPKKQLSPRVLWETVEKAGYQPTKIAGPAGVFKAKPKS